jgi:hypothetical protein
MRWTDMSEKDMLKAWAKEEYSPELEQQYLPKPDAQCESYWEKYDDRCDISEFGFNTIPELNAQLKDIMLENRYDDILLPLTVATFSGAEKVKMSKTIGDNNHNNLPRENGDGFEIPEFVYVF